MIIWIPPGGGLGGPTLGDLIDTKPKDWWFVLAGLVWFCGTMVVGCYGISNWGWTVPWTIAGTSAVVAAPAIWHIWRM